MWILVLVLTPFLGPVLPSDTTASYVVDAVVVRASPWDRTLNALPLTALEVRWTSGGAYHALAKEPGLMVKDYVQFQGLSVRGSSSEEVKVLFEGFPFQPQQSGFADFAVLPKVVLGSAEIVRTANASYFGAGAMAGMVDLHLPSTGSWLQVGSGSRNPLTFFFQTRWSSPSLSGRWGWAWERQSSQYKAPTSTLSGPVLIRHAGGWKTGLFAEIWSPWGRGLFLGGWSRRAAPWLPWSTPKSDTLETRFSLLGWETPSLRSSITLWNTFYYTEEGSTAEHREWQWHEQWHHNIWLLDFSWIRLTSTTVGHRTRVHLSPGVRQDILVGRARLFLSFRSDFYSSPFRAVPTGFLGLRLPSGLYLSLSRGFRPPTFNELYWPEDAYTRGNPSLHPEIAQELEIGWKHSREHRSWSSAFYRRAYRNMIRWSPDSTGKWRPINLQDVDLMGIEMQGRIVFASRFTVEAGGEWIFWHHGPNLIYTPSHTAYLEAHIQNFRLRWSFVGPRPERITGPKVLPAFHLIDLGGQWFLRVPQLTISVSVQNLLNQPVQWVRGYPMPGRTWRFMVTWQQKLKRRPQ